MPIFHAKEKRLGKGYPIPKPLTFYYWKRKKEEKKRVRIR